MCTNQGTLQHESQVVSVVGSKALGKQGKVAKTLGFLK